MISEPELVPEDLKALASSQCPMKLSRLARCRRSTHRTSTTLSRIAIGSASVLKQCGHKNGHNRCFWGVFGSVRSALSYRFHLVDAVGIEPTTCRLRATEFACPPATIVCYKPLYKIRLRAAQKIADCYLYSLNCALF